MEHVVLDGVLDVKVVRAKWLANRDMGLSKSDPYATVSLCETRLCRTMGIVNDDCPEWNYAQKVHVEGRVPETATVLVEVWDADVKSRDDFLGQVEFGVQQLAVERKPAEGVFTLRPRKRTERVSGDITLAIAYEHGARPEPEEHVLKVRVGEDVSSTPWFNPVDSPSTNAS